MKYRNGFVTNSSSSSYILTFTKKEFKNFKEECECSNYEDLYKLIKLNLIKDKQKYEELKENLLKSYIWEKRLEYMEKNLKPYKEYRERIKQEEEIVQTKEYKQYIEDYLKTTDYESKLKKLEEAEIVSAGTVWDTSGGLLPFAIRNGLLQQAFRKYVVMVWNVG